MKIVDMQDAMIPSTYGDTGSWASADGFGGKTWIELTMRAKYTRQVERFGIYYTDPSGSSRIEHGGPQVAGPHGSLIAQASVIASSPVARPDVVIHVAEGDRLILNGQRMVIVDDKPYDYPRLVTEAEYGAIVALRAVGSRPSVEMMDQLRAQYRA
jgi:hypothetical protein